MRIIGAAPGAGKQKAAPITFLHGMDAFFHPCSLLCAYTLRCTIVRMNAVTSSAAVEQAASFHALA
jgi:hypothetical protein